MHHVAAILLCIFGAQYAVGLALLLVGKPDWLPRLFPYLYSRPHNRLTQGVNLGFWALVLPSLAVFVIRQHWAAYLAVAVLSGWEVFLAYAFYRVRGEVLSALHHAALHGFSVGVMITLIVQLLSDT